MNQREQQKKERELFFLRQLRERMNDFPVGPLLYSERPDFLVHGCNTIIGIEVAELPEAEGSSKVQRQQEGVRDKILIGARQLVEGYNLPSFEVRVLFSTSDNIHSKQQKDLSGILAQTIRDMFPYEGLSAFLDNRHGNAFIPACFRLITINRHPNLTAQNWSITESGWIKEDFFCELQNAIDKKGEKYDEYLGKCDDCWLLLVASWQHASSFRIASELTTAHTYRSRFSRNFFLEAFTSALFELITEKKSVA